MSYFSRNDKKVDKRPRKTVTAILLFIKLFVKLEIYIVMLLFKLYLLWIASSRSVTVHTVYLYHNLWEYLKIII